MAEEKCQHVLWFFRDFIHHVQEGRGCVMRQATVLVAIVLALVWCRPTVAEGAGFALIQ